MDVDKTFCTGLRCERKESCERWSINLERKAKKEKFDLSKVWLSIGSFCEPDGGCKFYEPMEK